MNDAEDRRWLEARFAALEEKIEAAMERLKDITTPIARDVERLRVDINLLFDRTRQVESDVAIVKADKDDRTNSTATIVAVVAVLAAVVTSIVGFVL